MARMRPEGSSNSAVSSKLCSPVESYAIWTSCQLLPWSCERSAKEPMGILDEPNSASITGLRSGFGVPKTEATHTPLRVTTVLRKEPASSELKGSPRMERLIQVFLPSREVRQTKLFREKASSLPPSRGAINT